MRTSRAVKQCRHTEAASAHLWFAMVLETTQVTLKGIDRLKAELKNASIELWGMGEHGEIFDANGCLTSKFLTEHRGLILKRR